MSRPDGETLEGVAIIGLAGRAPGAGTLEQFWANLAAGVEAVRPLTDEELLAEGVSPELLADPNYVRAASVIDGIEEFDAQFFGYSPAEAELIDPQQRIFLECAWEAFEAAGYDPRRYDGVVGVFGGGNRNEYLLNNVYPSRHTIRSDELSLILGNDKDYVTTRVAYKLDLRGPAVTVLSACSTSLVAINFAVDALLAGQCDIALAGGVSVLVPQKTGYFYREGGIWSPDGHCRPFDADAKGTIFGSGAGVVALKRLADAMADGDPIHAVIKGAAINNDGAAKVGFAAPSVEGQSKVVAEAQAIAGVHPESITYVEAHGTGTPIGDPIEVAALTRAFAARTKKRQYCAIGSLKSNIGHANTAAGALALIKTVLAMEHRQIPPSINFQRPNPQIDFPNTPFYVNTTLAPWTSPDGVLRAGVSSFGVGGTNAHLVLEEAPAREPSAPSGRCAQLLVFSARTSRALDEMTARLADHLQARPDAVLADVAYTLALGRTVMSHRRFAVACDATAAVSALRTPGPESVSDGTARPVAFMFTGQGAQYVGMTRGLYEQESIFRETVDRCTALLTPHLGLNLLDVLFAPDERHEDATARLTETALAQPALFVVEYALAKLVMSWGVEPDAMIGHSIGEYVAACLAGVFPLEAALRLVALRGRLMNRLPPGAMMAIPAPESDVRPLLGADLALAAVNAPSLCVVSGPTAAIDRLEAELPAKGLAGRRLHTSHAFHSPMMDPILDEFAREVARIRPAAPTRPYLSNVTGTWITAEDATDPSYWARHLRGTVRFSDGVGLLLENPDRVLLELGPGETLSALARRRPDRTERQAVISTVRPPRQEGQDGVRLLEAVGALWSAGCEIDWKAFFEPEDRRRVPLPTYPFQRQRLWIDAKPAATSTAAAVKRPRTFEDWFAIPSWRTSLPPVAPVEASQGPCVLLSDDSALAKTLADRLRASGRTVTVLNAGTSCSIAAGASGHIRPDRREDYEAMFEALGPADDEPLQIVHAWAAGPAATAADQARGFYALLALAQAIGTRRPKARVNLVALTAGLFAVTGAEALVPEAATILGPCRTIPHEYANVTCRVVDLDAVDLTGAAVPASVDALAAELISDRREPVVAWRNRRRWVQTYEPVTLPPAAGQPRLRTGGVYVVTGGWGGLGLVLAEHLAERVRAKLVMIGRRDLPQREAWDEWLETHPASDETSRRIVAARRLEARGGEVLALAADVSDAARLQAAITEARRRFGSVRGVIHAAGVPGGGLIQFKDPEAAARVLAPKVAGVQALDRALGDLALDFFVLCSSTYAVESALGQVDYAAANAFLDAWAHARVARGQGLTISINWDGWDEVGMAAAATRTKPPAEAPRAAGAHPLLGEAVRRTASQRVFVTEVGADSHWVFDEHRVRGLAAPSGTTLLELVSAAVEGPTTSESVELRDVTFTGVLGIDAGTTRRVCTVLERSNGGGFSFKVASRPTSGWDTSLAWREHAVGSVRRLPAPARAQIDLAAIRGRCRAAEPPVRGIGGTASDPASPVQWGPRWRSVRAIAIGDREAIVDLALDPAFADDVRELGLHPALLDVATGVAASYFGGDENCLPVAYGRISVHGRLPDTIVSHARLREGGSGESSLVFDVTITDRDGAVLVDIERFVLRRLHAAAPLGAGSARPAMPAARAWQLEQLCTRREAGRTPAISPAQGIEAFERILAGVSVPQIIVSAHELSIVRTAEATADGVGPADTPAVDDQATGAGDSGQAPSDGRHERPAVDAVFVAPRTDMERKIAEMWQDVLRIRQIGVDDNFFEIGGDSVLAIQIVSRARDAGLTISPDAMFEYQTIAALAERLQGSAAEAAAPSPEGPDAEGAPDEEFGWSADDLQSIRGAIEKAKRES